MPIQLVITGMAEKALAKNKPSFDRALAVQTALDLRIQDFEGFMRSAHNRDTVMAAASVLDQVELQIASVQEQLEGARERVNRMYKRMHPGKAIFIDGVGEGSVFDRLGVRFRKTGPLSLDSMRRLYSKVKHSKLPALTEKEKKTLNARVLKRNKRRLLAFLWRGIDAIVAGDEVYLSRSLAN